MFFILNQAKYDLPSDRPGFDAGPKVIWLFKVETGKNCQWSKRLTRSYKWMGIIISTSVIDRYLRLQSYRVFNFNVLNAGDKRGREKEGDFMTCNCRGTQIARLL